MTPTGKAVVNPPSPQNAIALVRCTLAALPQAHTNDRAAAVNALARAYLQSDLDAEARAEAEIAMTRALDDPEPRVRRALAQALAGARAAPRHVVVALAGDAPAVARIVLAASPLLTDEDLVEAAATGDTAMQVAIARRPRISSKVCAALCEIGGAPAAHALLGNLHAAVSEAALWRLFERFAEDETVRLRFAARPGLTAALRAALAAATVEAYAAQAERFEPGQAGRLARDGREQAFVAIAGDAPAEQLVELVEWLRKRGHLTVGLLIRALAGGDVALIGESLAQMARVPRRRVVALMRAPRGLGFAALYRRAAMPLALLPAFRIAVERAGRTGGGVGVNHALTPAMLADIEALGDAACRPVVAKLWRLAAEGARADARDYALPPTAGAVETPLEYESAAPLLLLDAPGNENFAPPVRLDIAIEDGIAA
jgi:uncharacterized protein (DUF2336 family)